MSTAVIGMPLKAVEKAALATTPAARTFHRCWGLGRTVPVMRPVSSKPIILKIRKYLIDCPAKQDYCPMSSVNFDVDVLRSFSTGVALGSFARAADRLGRSTSAVSAQLKKL